MRWSGRAMLEAKRRGLLEILGIDDVKLFTKKTLLFRAFCLGYCWVNIDILEQGVESWIASSLVMDNSAGLDEELRSRVGVLSHEEALDLRRDSRGHTPL